MLCRGSSPSCFRWHRFLEFRSHSGKRKGDGQLYRHQIATKPPVPFRLFLQLSSKGLHHRLYFDAAYTAAARIVGYSGIEMAGFWERAKALNIPSDKLLSAVYDLTRHSKREEKPSRYELTGQARDYCWVLLGPAAEDGDRFWRHADGAAEAHGGDRGAAGEEEKARKSQIGHTSRRKKSSERAASPFLVLGIRIGSLTRGSHTCGWVRANAWRGRSSSYGCCPRPSDGLRGGHRFR